MTMFKKCPQCGSTLIAPESSEFHGERRVRHLWNCDDCAYVFESNVYLARQTAAETINKAAA
jgi:ribosomal protein L37AE/L43A